MRSERLRASRRQPGATSRYSRLPVGATLAVPLTAGRGSAAVAGPPRNNASGFTLIELILVMVIITVAVGLSAPRLAAFFRGRALDSEARRMLAITRYAQDRAASEGFPLRMWFDPQNSEYGVKADQSYQQEDSSEQRFKIGDGITVQVRTETKQNTSKPIARRQPSRTAIRKPDKQDNLDAIRFLPDGLIDPDATLSITLTDADNYSLTVSPTQNRLSYEIVSGANR